MTSASMPSPASRSAAATARSAMIDAADDRDVAPGAADRRLADRHAIGVRRHRALGLVQQLVLEDQHRVRIVDRREQQALGVVRRRRLHDLEARHVREPRFEALAVLRRGAGARAARQPHDHRHARLAAEHEADLRRLVDDLLHRQRDEIRELDLEHRPHAGQRGADRRAGDAQLADRRVDHALAAEARGRGRRRRRTRRRTRRRPRRTGTRARRPPSPAPRPSRIASA